MLLFLKRVFEEYKTFVVKMNDGLHAIEATRRNFEFLCDVKLSWGSFTSCPCWKYYMDLSNLLEVVTYLCVTL
jgi:hypothetical protein